MGKNIQKSSPNSKKQQTPLSQSYQQQSHHQEKYSNSDDDVLFSQNTPLYKHKSISKSKVTRIFKPQDRFLPQHIRRYYLFPFFYSTLYPFFKISWKNWKPNGIYKKMAQFLSNISPTVPNKTPSQCKSYDQRMKYIHYQSNHESIHFDLLQAALKSLQQEQIDDFSRQTVVGYISKMEQKSIYIQFLQKNMNAFDDEQNEKEQIMGEQKKQEATLLSNGINEDQIFNDFFQNGYQASVL